MRRGRPVTKVLAFVVIVAATAAAATRGAIPVATDASVAAQTFLDPLGDATCCLDIGTVTVSNDAAGMITFRVELPNQPVAETARVVTVYIDADLDRLTGGLPLPGTQVSRRRGPDYRIRLQAGIDPTASLDRLPGPTATQISVSALEATYDRGWTVSVDRRLLGGPGAFEFFVLAGLYETDSPTWVDDAPDVGTGQWGWRYDTGLPPLVAPKPVLTAATRPTLAPNPPRAGRRLVVRLPFELSAAEGAAVSVRCAASVAGRLLRQAAGSRTVANGSAACAWTMPKLARGKLVRGSLNVGAGGVTALRRFSARIQ